MWIGGIPVYICPWQQSTIDETLDQADHKVVLDSPLGEKYCNIPIRSALPYLIEVPPKWSGSCHKIVVPPHNRSTSNMNFMESSHKYIVQTAHLLLKITMAAMTACFIGLGLFKQSYVSNTLYTHVSNTL